MDNLQGGTLALEHHYHLDQRLDSFGLVTVYAGIQDPFDLPVRISVYDGLVDAGAAPSVADRIKDSAHRASRLDEPGLLATIDFGEIEQGVPFVVERTVPGPSLADRIESKSVFAPSDVADLVARLAGLLQTAHEHQFYHGAIKPEWVLFADDDAPFDRAHLAHLGIGPSMAELVDMSEAVLTTDLVDAFAPECFDVAARDDDAGESDESDSASDSRPHLTAAADQWALAALAYRLLVGVHPFFDDPVDASEGILRIKTEEPPSLQELGIDEPLATVVDRALSRDPDDRWPTIERFSEAFCDAVFESDASSSTSSTSDDDSPTAKVPGPSEPESGGEDPVDSAIDDADSATPPGPRPSGQLLTAALAALVVTNLVWFFVVLDGRSQPEDEQNDAPPPQVAVPDTLPVEGTGPQIDTDPSDSEIIEVRADGTEQPLGDTTPFVIAELLDERSKLEVLLRQPGYHDHRVTIEASDTRQDILLDLVDDADDT